MTEKIEIYTDGSCYPNNGTGQGGWAFVVVEDGKEIYRESGGEKPSTSNRMEMVAMLEAFRFCNEEIPHENITYYTDSNYTKNNYKNKLDKWSRAGWRDSYGQNRKNKDLWQQFYELRGKDIKKVKGHSNNTWNDLADELAAYKKHR